MEQQLGRRLKTKGTKISLFLLIFHLCKKEKPHLVCHGLWTFSHNCRENTAAGMLQQQNILFGPESHNKMVCMAQAQPSCQLLLVQKNLAEAKRIAKIILHKMRDVSQRRLNAMEVENYRKTKTFSQTFQIAQEANILAVIKHFLYLC